YTINHLPHRYRMLIERITEHPASMIDAKTRHDITINMTNNILIKKHSIILCVRFIDFLFTQAVKNTLTLRDIMQIDKYVYIIRLLYKPVLIQHHRSTDTPFDTPTAEAMGF